MYPEIGSFEAKTQLSRLLREVERGRRYTITLRGRPVADLIPSGSALRVEAAAAVAAMRATRRVRGVGAGELAAWVADGRR
ncbi:MAG: type II toxin-antitoxin system prevent-host-death family antitoxin [Longimicrobiales bacterium]|nr:type II toxin-antitoxin system prevent-host-death family antitoxin [Longimicrobiales bacterium]